MIRIGFAAPLVIVVACGPAPPETLPVEAPIAAVADAAVDAPEIDAGVDAAEPDAAPAPRRDHVTMRLPDRYVQAPGFVSCHSFGKSVGCNPPRPDHVDAEAREVELEDVAPSVGGQLVSLAIGQDDGLEPRMKLVVRAPLRDGAPPSARIVEVERERMTVEIAIDHGVAVAGGLLELSFDPQQAWVPLHPPTVTAAILSTQEQGPDTIVELGVGTRDGVDKDWRGVAIDARGKPIRGGAVSLIKLMKQRTFAKVKLTPDQLKRARVRLDAPEDPR